MDERQRFEAWYEADAMPLEADWFKRSSECPEEYEELSTQSAWEGWQARAAQEPRTGDEYRLDQSADGLIRAIENYRSGYSCGYSDAKNGARMRDKDAASAFFSVDGVPDVFAEPRPVNGEFKKRAWDWFIGQCGNPQQTEWTFSPETIAELLAAFAASERGQEWVSREAVDNLESAVRVYRHEVHSEFCECKACRHLLKILVSDNYTLPAPPAEKGRE